MEYKQFGSQILLRLDPGDEVIASLEEVCRQTGVTSGCVSGIGAAKELNLRVAAQETGGFIFRSFHGLLEITSLSGNIAQTEEGISIHIHATAADRNMHLYGGHLASCIIAITGEIFITVLDGVVTREAQNHSPIGTLRF